MICSACFCFHPNHNNNNSQPYGVYGIQSSVLLNSTPEYIPTILRTYPITYNLILMISLCKIGMIKI